MAIYVFRHSSVIPFGSLEESIETLKGHCKYAKGAWDTPLRADCLTAVRYIFKKALGINIDLTWIGNMPHRLAFLSEWRVLKIPIEQARYGDLFFVGNRIRHISHVAIFSENGIFHCSQRAGTAVVQPTEDFFLSYQQKLGFIKLLQHVDSRTNS